MGHRVQRLDEREVARQAGTETRAVGAEVTGRHSAVRPLYGDETGRPGRESSVVWRWFCDPTARSRSPEADHGEQSRVWVADLRATAARRRGDADVEDLVGALLATSPEFAALWERHEVAVRRQDTKRVRHPLVGVIELDCEVLLTPEHDQRLVLLTARPGSEAVQQLDLLRVVATQQLQGSR